MKIQPRSAARITGGVGHRWHEPQSIAKAVRRYRELMPVLDMSKRVLTVLVLLSLAGCAGLVGHRDPVRVTVNAIEILESTMFEQLYRITLRVQNRTEQEITIRGGSFDLEINGRDFGSGVSDSVLRVPPYSDAKVDVRMVSTLFGMLRLFQGMASADDAALHYEISGRFVADGILGGVAFRESGEIALPTAEPAGAPSQPPG
jgi:LEA14-like dessication related protein